MTAPYKIAFIMSVALFLSALCLQLVEADGAGIEDSANPATGAQAPAAVDGPDQDPEVGIRLQSEAPAGLTLGGDAAPAERVASAGPAGPRREAVTAVPAPGALARSGSSPFPVLLVGRRPGAGDVAAVIRRREGAAAPATELVAATGGSSARPVQAPTPEVAAAPQLAAAAAASPTPEPEPETGTGTGLEPATYTVQKNDTLGGIARSLYGSATAWQRLARANPLVDPARLKVGQVLRLPDDTPLTPAATDAAFADLEAPEPAVAHRIRAGDSLSTLASRYYGDSSLWRLIFRANRDQIGNNPNALRVGMDLKIPPRPPS